MSHYFETPDGPARFHQVDVTFWGRDYSLVSAPGVFSAHRLDPGTTVLARLTVPPTDRPARFLDLGCGFGPIAVALAANCPQAQVDAIDVNQRATELTRHNAEHLGLTNLTALGPDNVPPVRTYDEIWSNPPIRIGKTALHGLLLHWFDRLNPGGSATLVVAKNLGADSLQVWLGDQGWPTDRLGSAKGFRILRSHHPATDKTQ